MPQLKQNRVIYISGGCRSGKTAYAQELAESFSGPRAYLATCPLIDSEMEQRIVLHQQQRAGQGWQTIEAPLNLIDAVQQAKDFEVLLIDSLTLWINNLLYQASEEGYSLTEKQIAKSCSELVKVCRQRGQTIIFVTDELGMGLVPVDAASRHYRDCLGRCNQIIAKLADEAVFIVSGLPLFLKGTTSK